MPRTARMVIPDEQAVYHVMSRTALDKFPMGSVENDYLLNLIKRFTRLYFTEILGFCLMGNHFHLLVKMVPDTGFSDDDIEKRLKLFYGEDYKMPAGQMPLLQDIYSQVVSDCRCLDAASPYYGAARCI